MSDDTIDKILNKYPYFKDRVNYTIFLSKEEMDKIVNSPKISVYGRELTINLLIKLFEDNRCYAYLSKLYNDEIDHICISNIIWNTQLNDKALIVKAFEYLLKDAKIKLSPKAIKRYLKLKNKISYSKFLMKYHNVNCNIEIDNIKYSIPFKYILSFMTMPQSDFDAICANDNIKKINTIPKEHLAYASYIFIIVNNILKNYDLPKEFINRYEEIASMQKIDIEAINKHIMTYDLKHKEIKLDPTLEREILKDLPEDTSLIEKAIYIYIKMCKIFTYDEEYYAMNKQGSAYEKHRHLSYISKINLHNNKLVCFEFNIIYAKLLSDLGINFIITYQNRFNDAYGEAHASIAYRADKFLITADSVTSILKGDIVRAKLNAPLVGLKVQNKCEKTREEFYLALNKMYHLFQSREEGRPFPEKDAITSLLPIEGLTDYYKVLAYIIRNASRINIIGIDSLSYTLQVEKLFFGQKEHENNFHLAILRDNNTIFSSSQAKVCVIFTINEDGFDVNEENNIYFQYNCSTHKLKRISKEKLESEFAEGKCEYIREDSKEIPGIKKKKK